MGCCDRGVAIVHRPDPAPERRAGRERRRAGLAERSGDDEEMAVVALVGVGGPPREMRARVAFLEEERRDAARDLVGRDAEVDHDHAPGARRARMQQQAPLVAGEGGGQAGPDRRSEERARIRAETGRQVERDDRPLGGIDQLDGAGHEPAGGAGEAGAEERIDHHVSAPEVAGKSVEVGLDADLLDAPPEPAERRAGVAADVVAPCDQDGLHARALRPESSRDDEAVAAIVPLAAENRDALAADGREGTRDRVRGAGAGLLHQPDPGDPERRDGAGVERPHLGRREDGQHGYSPSEGRGASRSRETRGEERGVDRARPLGLGLARGRAPALDNQRGRARHDAIRLPYRHPRRHRSASPGPWRSPRRA